MRDDGTSAPQAARAGSLLSQRRFLPLFLVQALGAFNDNVFKNAFVALLTFRLVDELELSLSVGVLTTIAAGIFILPFALFAPFAGQIADSIDKARMMRGVKLAEIVLMALAAIAFHVQSVAMLYTLLFLMGAQSAFFAPIKYGVLPHYLDSTELVRGNGFIQAGTFFAILLGTIAGLNLVLTAAGVTLTSIAVVAIAIVGWFASRYAPPAPPISGALALLPRYGLRGLGDDLSGPETKWFLGLWALGIGGLAVAAPAGLWIGGAALTALLGALYWLWPSIADSVAAARSAPVAFRTIFAISWFWFTGATFLALLPAFAKEQLQADETVVTVLLAAFSIGVAIGSVICAVLYRGAVRVGFAPWGAVGIALFSIDLAFAVPAAAPLAEGGPLQDAASFVTSAIGLRVLIDFIGLAICAGIYVTPLNAVYQHAAPEDARGRVVACSNMVDSAFMAVSSVVILVLLGQALTPQTIFGLVGGTGLVAAFLVARQAPDTPLGRAALRLWPIGAPR